MFFQDFTNADGSPESFLLAPNLLTLESISGSQTKKLNGYSHNGDQKKFLEPNFEMATASGRWRSLF